ncbi:MAG: DUF4365 domain-containing protein [Elusimicrobia bacterium]|nr:DUF4365 domain-containing protein [Elusimicrobiota bacterium]
MNAAQAFFERCSCVFQEVNQQNDFGKDAYVDLGKGGTISPLCIALQIKSGESFRAVGGDYFIPVEKHASSWRHSTVPIFGLVYDPTDRLLRWADLTGYLRAHPHQEGGRIPVSREAILNEESLHQAFASAVSVYALPGGDSIAFNLLSAAELQTDAIFDAWALGRKDARYLIILRRLILDLYGVSVRRAIVALSHVGSHPDIFWTEKNWIPETVKEQVLPSFRWSPDELVHMMRAIEAEEWGRGTLGQSFDVLIYEDPDIVGKLRATVGIFFKQSEIELAVRAAALTLAHSREARQELSRLIELHPQLKEDEWFQAIADLVQQEGYLSLY